MLHQQFTHESRNNSEQAIGEYKLKPSFIMRRQRTNIMRRRGILYTIINYKKNIYPTPFLLFNNKRFSMITRGPPRLDLLDTTARPRLELLDDYKVV